MSSEPRSVKRVLAIDPTSRGFGYVVLEGHNRPVDWGVRTLNTSETAGVVRQVLKIMKRNHVHTLVMEDTTAAGTRRCERIRQLLVDIQRQITKNGIKTRRIPMRKVKQVLFAFRAATKHQIAQEIARQLPELASRLPRQRKPWMVEDYWMAMFDAAAFALAYFYLRSVKRDSKNAV